MTFVYFFTLIFIKNAAALDITAAFEKGLFEKLHLEEDNLRPTTFDPYRKPSQAYFWNREWFKSEKSNVELEFNIHNLHENFFFPGLSLIVLKTTFEKRQVKDDDDDIEIYLSKNNKDNEDDEDNKPDGKITKSHDFPKTGYSDEHVFQTWSKSYEDSNYTIKIMINNLKSLENIYFVVTAYRISRNLGNTRSCEDNSRENEWFDCNRSNVENLLLCISDELTCNTLPNCASTQLPNPDENCEYQISFENALKLLLYTVTVVFFLILVAGRLSSV